MTAQDVDVLIVTALKLERLAVRAHMEHLRVETASSLAADLGTSASSPGQRIAVIETGPGNIEAGLFSARAEEQFRPKYIAMLGVAGGVKDVTIGDVVASRKVYWVEGGKEDSKFKPRPEFAPVSSELVQLARAAATDGTWLAGGKSQAGRWAAANRDPLALVAPIVVGEKVVADRGSGAARLIAETYSDAVAVDMEDFGALRGGAASERARVIAIRGISDLLSAKSDADAGGSQELAAANAAAFLFDVLDRIASTEATPSRTAVERHSQNVVDVARQLYPAGPQHDDLWERAGGDPSRLTYDGSGSTRWRSAIRLIEKGGGGNITMDSLVTQMRVDYPKNPLLAELT